MTRLGANPPERILWACPISLGEIECGLRITNTTDLQRREDCRRFIATSIDIFVHPIETTTRESYAEIMERIWRDSPPPSGRIETQKHLSNLGVDVNDVWIAAVALERNLVLLTNDGMDAIKRCVPEIKFDNWLA